MSDNREVTENHERECERFNWLLGALRQKAWREAERAVEYAEKAATSEGIGNAMFVAWESAHHDFANTLAILAYVATDEEI